MPRSNPAGPDATSEAPVMAGSRCRGGNTTPRSVAGDPSLLPVLGDEPTATVLTPVATFTVTTPRLIRPALEMRPVVPLGAPGLDCARTAAASIVVPLPVPLPVPLLFPAAGDAATPRLESTGAGATAERGTVFAPFAAAWRL